VFDIFLDLAGGALRVAKRRGKKRELRFEILVVPAGHEHLHHFLRLDLRQVRRSLFLGSRFGHTHRPPGLIGTRVLGFLRERLHRFRPVGELLPQCPVDRLVLLPQVLVGVLVHALEQRQFLFT